MDTTPTNSPPERVPPPAEQTPKKSVAALVAPAIAVQAGGSRVLNQGQVILSADGDSALLTWGAVSITVNVTEVEGPGTSRVSIPESKRVIFNLEIDKAVTQMSVRWPAALTLGGNHCAVDFFVQRLRGQSRTTTVVTYQISCPLS